VMVPTLLHADSTKELAATRIVAACTLVTHAVVNRTGGVTIWSTEQDQTAARSCARNVDLSIPYEDQGATRVYPRGGAIVLK